MSVIGRDKIWRLRWIYYLAKHLKSSKKATVMRRLSVDEICLRHCRFLTWSDSLESQEYTCGEAKQSYYPYIQDHHTIRGLQSSLQSSLMFIQSRIQRGTYGFCPSKKKLWMGPDPCRVIDPYYSVSSWDQTPVIAANPNKVLNHFLHTLHWIYRIEQHT